MQLELSDDIVGIDFGTSTSRLAIMDAEVPTLLETERGQTIPSFVAIDDEKKILVGQVANYHAIGYPADSFFNIKTFVGEEIS
ncbi:Chaperone protein DnaK [Camellia lanceoleosa]|uniref:Chaperone protein DnaK n=1 Tax=Camellia lanceoleosa TaxID=1840588 RepID=A0ACC0G1K2_9ERIC|nr:Chaperone protein DnaK [Camellia lanceoleosa]